MRPLKSIVRHPLTQAVLGRLIALYIELVFRTGRWEVVGGDIPGRYWDADIPFIMAFWHGRLLMMPHAWRRGRRVSMLISQHRDGQLIARAIAHYDVGTIAGSSTRGGMAALRAMLKALKSGEYVGITPDGPRGPRMRASAGLINLARLSGAPIIPATFSARRRRVLGSWDRFVVALPFSRGVYVWGRPIEVPAGAGEAALEACREEVENRLNALTMAADARMGHAAIEPAPWNGAAPAAEVAAP